MLPHGLPPADLSLDARYCQAGWPSSAAPRPVRSRSRPSRLYSVGACGLRYTLLMEVSNSHKLLELIKGRRLSSPVYSFKRFLHTPRTEAHMFSLHFWLQFHFCIFILSLRSVQLAATLPDAARGSRARGALPGLASLTGVGAVGAQVRSFSPSRPWSGVRL